MKKILFSTSMIVAMMLITNTAANAFSFLGLNINCPSSTATSTPTATISTPTTEAVAKIKSQIDTINTKITSFSTDYQSVIDDIVNNLIPEDKRANYQKIVENLKATETGTKLNFDIAQNGENIINNMLQSNSIDLNNLSEANIKAIKDDLTNLKSIASSYNSIITDANNLINSIKKDPKNVILLHSDLKNLTNNIKDTTNQVKSMTKLNSAITKALSKANITIK